MVGGILAHSVLSAPMVIVDFKNPPPIFYKTNCHVQWSKYPTNNSIKQKRKII